MEQDIIRSNRESVLQTAPERAAKVTTQEAAHR